MRGRHREIGEIKSKNQKAISYPSIHLLEVPPSVAAVTLTSLRTCPKLDIVTDPGYTMLLAGSVCLW